MSTGQLLDHTFALYRKNFLLFVGIATVGPAASVIFQLLTVGANVGSPFGASGRLAAGAALANDVISFEPAQVCGIGQLTARESLDHL